MHSSLAWVTRSRRERGALAFSHGPVVCLLGQIYLAAVLLAPTVAWSQTPDSNKGKQVIDRAVAALGGDNFLHMQNRSISGHLYGFFHNELSGLEIAKILVEYLPQPVNGGLQVREREVIGKKQDYFYLFTPKQAFEVTFRGVRPLSDDDWSHYARTTKYDVLYMLRCRLQEPGMQFDYVDSEVYLSRHVEIVDITDADNQTVRVYFDHNTGLPVHQTFTFRDDKLNIKQDEATEYDKYRDIGGGIMWPYSVERERNGYKTSQTFADEAQANQKIRPGLFDLPAGAKMLKKAD